MSERVRIFLKTPMMVSRRSVAGRHSPTTTGLAPGDNAPFEARDRRRKYIREETKSTTVLPNTNFDCICIGTAVFEKIL